MVGGYCRLPARPKRPTRLADNLALSVYHLTIKYKSYIMMFTMFEQLRATAIEWNQRTDDKQKLQQSLIALLMVVIFLAGVVSLFNDTRSRQLMYIALALITTFITNFVVWNLLKASVYDKLPRPARTTRRQPARRR